MRKAIHRDTKGRLNYGQCEGDRCGICKNFVGEFGGNPYQGTCTLTSITMQRSDHCEKFDKRDWERSDTKAKRNRVTLKKLRVPIDRMHDPLIILSGFVPSNRMSRRTLNYFLTLRRAHNALLDTHLNGQNHAKEQIAEKIGRMIPPQATDRVEGAAIIARREALQSALDAIMRHEPELPEDRLVVPEDIEE